MKIFFDTSIIIASFIESHPHHDRAFPWLLKAKQKKIDMYIAAHTLAETYAVLTTLPLSPKISPQIAKKLIKENIEDNANITTLTSTDYLEIIKELSDLDLSGGIIYDAILVKSAEKSKAEKLLTFNTRDFVRLSNNPDFIISP